MQIAVFHFASRNEWYATQNMCPHRFAFVLSRGIVGDQQGEPKVSCPLHKRNFSLQTGACLTDDQTPAIETFPIRIEGDAVWLELPPTEELDTRLATGLFCNGGTAASTCSSHQPVALQTPELVATL